jgi:hypothetical protein
MKEVQMRFKIDGDKFRYCSRSETIEQEVEPYNKFQAFIRGITAVEISNKLFKQGAGAIVLTQGEEILLNNADHEVMGAIQGGTEKLYKQLKPEYGQILDVVIQRTKNGREGL